MSAMAWWILRVLSLYPIALGVAFCLPQLPQVIEPFGLQIAAGVALLVTGLFVMGSPYLPRRIGRWVRERTLRREGRHCASCGYDLRGTIDAKRYSCPECGAPVSWWAMRRKRRDA